jgi:hypothetical protein
VSVTWEPLTADRPKHGGWNRRDTYELRLTAKTIGYLNAKARAFLFDGQPAGVVRFEKESGNGQMSIVPADKGVKVNKNGHVAVTAITAQTKAELPITILLAPFEDEQRLIFAGVRK